VAVIDPRPGPGAAVSEYALGYADDGSASAALARLTEDAASCPGLATGGSIESPGPATSDGAGARSTAEALARAALDRFATG
jgi:hypothetical protein